MLLLILAAINSSKAQDQEQVIDEVIAVVGANYILASEVETQYLQYREQGDVSDARAMRCRIFEDLLFQKLMLNQAEIDSVEVTEDQVNQTMDARFRYYIQQFGSQEKMEKFYKKSLLEIKEDFRSIVRQQLMVDQVQQGLVKDVKVTPGEVRRMFNELSQDSIPTIAQEYEIGRIVIEPVISKEEMESTRERLKALRERILNGENFNALAVLYSEDPGSSKRGGEIGFVGRGQLYPEYEAAAFTLKKGEVSDIIKSTAGYHIIQLIERRGEQINTRHILLMPKVSNDEINRATKLLDSAAVQIRDKKMTFQEAALKYSDDPGKINKGLMVNPATGNTRFTSDQLDPKVLAVIEKLKVGEVSRPVTLENDEGKMTLQLLYLHAVSAEHKANLRDDYNAIQEWALNRKKGEAINKWIGDKISKTYFRISPQFNDCNFMHDWEVK